MEHIVAGSLERVEVLRYSGLSGARMRGVVSLTSRRGGEQASIDIAAERGGYGFETESWWQALERWLW